VNHRFFHRIWGQTAALLERSRLLGWVDLVLVAALAALMFGLRDLAREATEPLRQQVEIDLSPWALPRYTFFSLMRGLFAYGLSLGFTLVYGYWAAKDRTAERVLVPLLDVLQSIPVLSFLPGVVLALVYAFPGSNFGLELAAVIMIFTGQAWNMTFSFYHSVRAVPADQQEVARVYRFGWWRRFKWVELPYSMMGLVWNSMMSMAGGWVFLMINESFKLDEQNDFRLPGVGSYVSKALEEHEYAAIVWGLVAMVLMILALDQLFWRPVVVWAQKFRVEEGGATEEASSWFLNWLRRSRLVAWLREARSAERGAPDKTTPAREEPASTPESSIPSLRSALRAPRFPYLAGAFSLAGLVGLLTLMAWGGFLLVQLLRVVPVAQWAGLAGAAGLTLVRVLAAVGLATLWTVPAGLAIGLSPRLSRVLQPVVQVVASFPAPLLFPLLMAWFVWSGVSLNVGSVVLMLLGTQWYLLFNVIAGAMAVPADLREAARSYRITGWQRFWVLYVPALFPYLVTGWVTAAGGAWNLSIVSEYDVTGTSGISPARGLGAEISRAFADKQYAVLAASTLVMSVLVVAFNRTVWRRMYRVAEERFSLSK
jgi:NitT/TauT family transport system permease protein